MPSAVAHEFADPTLLGRALTHRSHGADNNERLEFLGDSVLNCVVAQTLLDRFPLAAEGELSRLRANLVNQQALFEVASQLGLGNVLKLGDGEAKTGGQRRPSILADAFEAVVGAVFVDAGYAAARAFVVTSLAQRLQSIDIDAPAKDAKTRLQEWLQARRHPLPRYAVVTITGEAHAQRFDVECTIDVLALRTHGTGSSRRAAEQAAADAAFAQLR
ncbi:MAG: ribonuclease III [Proteobacteria bacterium]|nr:ribonuclease III [Burkholderiales bacterium]